MDRMNRYTFGVAIIVYLLFESSWGSLLYSNLHTYTPWLRRTNDRWNLLTQLYPWIYMAHNGVPAARATCPRNETYAQFGRPCGKSCGTYGQFCPIVRLNSCICIGAHVRNQHGKCIHYTDCTKTLDDVEFIH